MKPIRPEEIGKARRNQLPDEVIAAFNECITKHWDQRAATFEQKEVVALILAKMPALTRDQVFEQRLLNIETAFRVEGWQVDYDRPGYNETYEPTFTFKRLGRGR